jgi:hypothetical protein
MQHITTRIRRGEAVAGLGAALLLALLFLTPWFRFGSGAGRVATDADGWHGLPTLRWLIVVTALTGLLLLISQATRRAPALPVTLSVISTTLGALTTLALIIRLPTDSGSPLVGAFAGLLAAAALTVGGFMSLRREDGWVPDEEHPIETIVIGPPTHRRGTAAH